MTIDYQSLTVEQLQNMSEEEFNQLDPNLLPQSSGPSELTSDMLTNSNSNEVPGTQALQENQVTQPEVVENNQALESQPTPAVEQNLEETQVGAEQSEGGGGEKDTPPGRCFCRG